MKYEQMLREASGQAIQVFERNMQLNNKGLYSDAIVWINKNIPTRTEKACVLAEELGHHFTTVGDILDQSKVENRKQELRARAWAYQKLLPLESFILAHRTGIRNRYELADYLNVTEGFLDSALKRYQEKYGLYAYVDGYTICFEPLGVIEMFE